jgi:hypothetical protein
MHLFVALFTIYHFTCEDQNIRRWTPLQIHLFSIPTCIIVCKLFPVMNTAKIKGIYVLPVVMADLCNITQSVHVLENISMIYSKKLCATDIGER